MPAEDVVLSKRTVDVAVNPLPVIVTGVPPLAGPLCGEIAVTVGATACGRW